MRNHLYLLIVGCGLIAISANVGYANSYAEDEAILSAHIAPATPVTLQSYDVAVVVEPVEIDRSYIYVEPFFMVRAKIVDRVVVAKCRSPGKTTSKICTHTTTVTAFNSPNLSAYRKEDPGNQATDTVR